MPSSTTDKEMAKPWSQRFLVLNKKTLDVYRSSTDTKPKQSLPLDTLSFAFVSGTCLPPVNAGKDKDKDKDNVTAERPHLLARATVGKDIISIAFTVDLGTSSSARTTALEPSLSAFYAAFNDPSSTSSSTRGSGIGLSLSRPMSIDPSNNNNNGATAASNSSSSQTLTSSGATSNSPLNDPTQQVVNVLEAWAFALRLRVELLKYYASPTLCSAYHSLVGLVNAHLRVVSMFVFLTSGSASPISSASMMLPQPHDFDFAFSSRSPLSEAGMTLLSALIRDPKLILPQRIVLGPGFDSGLAISLVERTATSLAPPMNRVGLIEVNLSACPWMASASTSPPPSSSDPRVRVLTHLLTGSGSSSLESLILNDCGITDDLLSAVEMNITQILKQSLTTALPSSSVSSSSSPLPSSSPSSPPGPVPAPVPAPFTLAALKRLDMNGNHITSRGVCSLVRILSLSSSSSGIVSLALARNALTDDALVALADWISPHRSSLHTIIKASSTSTSSPFPSFPATSLLHLDLSSNPSITDQGVHPLVLSLRDANTLRHLNLSGLDLLTSESSRSLTQLAASSTSLDLILWPGTRLGPEGIAAIRLINSLQAR